MVPRVAPSEVAQESVLGEEWVSMLAPSEVAQGREAGQGTVEGLVVSQEEARLGCDW